MLDTDVSVSGTAFMVAGKNITLDLNGHTVTYANTPSPVVTNGGFEAGSGRSVTGWDLSGAPAAVLAPNTHYLFGNQVLRLDNFSTTQTIISRSDHDSGGQLYVRGDNYSWGAWRLSHEMTISVIDATDESVLVIQAVPASLNFERGSNQSYCLYGPPLPIPLS